MRSVLAPQRRRMKVAGSLLGNTALKRLPNTRRLKPVGGDITAAPTSCQNPGWVGGDITAAPTSCQNPAWVGGDITAAPTSCQNPGWRMKVAGSLLGNTALKRLPNTRPCFRA